MRPDNFLLIVSLSAAVHAAENQSNLRSSLTFYAPFDGSTDAVVAKGDKQLHHAPKMVSMAQAAAGLPKNEFVTLVKGEGVGGGDCLRFHKKDPGMVFYHAKGNMPYQNTNWSGSVSFWLRLNPDQELEPGYTDPIQITSKAWNDASFFVEFSKDETPREFRLGVYPDFSVWNPDKKEWNDIPASEKPLAPVIRPPFKKEEWTHVLFTFERFNTGKKDGVARLYLNGELRASLPPREQTFTCDIDKAMIMPGLSYIGFFDDLAIFDRALSDSEIKSIHRAKSLGNLLK